MTREFVIVSTNHERQTVRTNSRDWGSFKRDLNAAGIDVHGMQCQFRANKSIQYTKDDQMLPAYDESIPDVLILTPSSTKNGNGI